MAELSRRAFLGALATSGIAVSGCVTEGYYRPRPLGTPSALGPPLATTPARPHAPRALAMFDGHRGEVLTWVDLLRGVQWSNVTVLGETHDDGVGHEVQAAIVDDMLRSDARTAVSMEMLDRSQQPDVDAFLRGEIDTDDFLERTGVANWAGTGSWLRWYHPMLELARSAGAPVIAANAPRRFVRMARLEGYPALRALPAEDRRLFDLPRRLDDGAYRRRFEELMRAMHAAGDPPREPEQSLMDATFRSQMIWDATMAASIARAIGPFGAPRAIHLVGQFHSDFRGGTVLELRRRAPLARILTVSLQPVVTDALRPEDRDRADVVIYTGLRTAAHRDQPSRFGNA